MLKMSRLDAFLIDRFSSAGFLCQFMRCIHLDHNSTKYQKFQTETTITHSATDISDYRGSIENKKEEDRKCVLSLKQRDINLLTGISGCRLYAGLS